MGSLLGDEEVLRIRRSKLHHFSHCAGLDQIGCTGWEPDEVWLNDSRRAWRSLLAEPVDPSNPLKPEDLK